MRGTLRSLGARGRSPAAFSALGLVVCVMLGAPASAVAGGGARAGESLPRIAFVEETLFGKVGGLVVVNSDGSGARRVATTDRSTSVHDPAWSAKGRRLAWIRGLNALVVGNADGSDRRVILRSGKADLDAPRWSADGRTIRVLRTIDPLGCRPRTQVVSVRPDGAGTRVVTPLALPAVDDPYCEIAPSPSEAAWSPDGRSVAVTYPTGVTSNHCLSESRVVVVSIPARAVVASSAPPAAPCTGVDADQLYDDSGPRWMPDGRTVVFFRSVEPDGSTMALDVRSGIVRTPTALEALAVFGQWSRRMAFVADSGARGLDAISPDGTRRLIYRTREPIRDIAVFG